MALSRDMSAQQAFEVAVTASPGRRKVVLRFDQDSA